MTQEQKELLLNDLCARLPYGVKCSFGVNDAVYKITGINPTCCGASEIQATHIKSEINGDFALNCCKPYLFPLSSMTEEQKEEYDYECNKDLKALSHSVVNRTYTKTRIATPLYYGIDWLNKNHFDYRGLIPMGLANDATELNIY